MQSLSFTPGRAFLSSGFTRCTVDVVFEDEGVAGYFFYACDPSQTTQERASWTRWLIYNVEALGC